MTIIQSFILGIVEGITEFLPISSTGHLIITHNLLQITDSPFIKSFEISIQLGAILSVVFLYYKKLFQIDTIKKLIIGFIPTGIAGLLLYKHIKVLLENIIVVAVSLIIGGVIILIVENWYSKKLKNNEIKDKEDITLKQAFLLGCYQIISMIPGVSRSGAVIIGGLLMKIDRKVITEFTFLLAIPTMFVATFYTIYKDVSVITNLDNLNALIVGFVTSFIVALIVIKYFLSYIRKHSFNIFGYYRIIIGIIIILFLI